MSDKFDFNNARLLFDLPEDLTYLDAAALGPLPLASVLAGQRGLARKMHPWTLKSDAFFKDTASLRPKLANLIQADSDGISFVPAASYGLAVAAQNLPIEPGSKILTLAEQFPSNVYTWRRLARDKNAELVTVSAVEGQSVSQALADAIDEQVSLIAIPQVRWTDGSLLDAEAISATARANGAAIVFDISQSCGVLEFDVTKIEPDFAVAVGYKWLLGPYSAGFLYTAPKWRNGIPLEENWISRSGSNDFARLIDYTEAYEPGARRYDVGERANFALLPALEASVDLLSGFGIEAIANYLRSLSDPLAQSLEALGFTCLPADQRSGHYLAAKLPEHAPRNLLQALLDRNIHISQRGDWLRISPHIYNTVEDCDRLAEAASDLCRN